MRNPFESTDSREAKFKLELQGLIEKNDPMEVAGRIIDLYGGTRPDNPRLKRGFELFLETLRDYAARGISGRDLPAALPDPTEPAAASVSDQFVRRWKEAVRMQFPVAEEMFDQAYLKTFPPEV